MKEKFRIIIWFLLMVQQGSLLLSQDNKIITSPKKISFGPKQFYMNNAIIILPEKDSVEYKFAFQQLQMFIKEQTGIYIPIAQFPEKNLQKAIRFSVSESLSPLPILLETGGPKSREAFRISIQADEINITANSSAGIYYAVQTLRQLMHADGTNSLFQELELEDYAAIACRAVMMDFSNASLLTVEERRFI